MHCEYDSFNTRSASVDVLVLLILRHWKRIILQCFVLFYIFIVDNIHGS